MIRSPEEIRQALNAPDLASIKLIAAAAPAAGGRSANAPIPDVRALGVSFIAKYKKREIAISVDEYAALKVASEAAGPPFDRARMS